MIKKIACDRLQLSFFNNDKQKHRWENGRCIYCKRTESDLKVHVCDCGCGTLIKEDELTTSFNDKQFIFGHETLDMFENHFKIF